MGRDNSRKELQLRLMKDTLIQTMCDLDRLSVDFNSIDHRHLADELDDMRDNLALHLEVVEAYLPKAD